MTNRPLNDELPVSDAPKGPRDTLEDIYIDAYAHDEPWDEDPAEYSDELCFFC